MVKTIDTNNQKDKMISSYLPNLKPFLCLLRSLTEITIVLSP